MANHDDSLGRNSGMIEQHAGNVAHRLVPPRPRLELGHSRVVLGREDAWALIIGAQPHRRHVTDREW